MLLSTTDRLIDFILQFDQIELFSKITNIPVEEISDCLSNRSRTTLNLMRNERKPSVTFYIQNGKVRMHDFADIRYRGDLIDIAGMVTNLNCNNPREFVQICKWLIQVAIQNKIVKHKVEYKDTNNEPTDIDYNIRPYNKYDMLYWEPYGITEYDMKRERIYPLAYATITNSIKTSVYEFNTKDRAYVIILYPLFYSKLYFVDRNKNSKLPRFITNFPHPIERPDLLVRGDVLILLKSTKCRAVFNNILSYISSVETSLINTTIVVNSLSSESVTFNTYWLNIIDKYDNHLIILDNDDVGTILNDRFILNGLNSTVITTGYKDLSDTYKLNKNLAINYVYDILCNLNIL